MGADTRAEFLGSGIARGTIPVDNHAFARIMETNDGWVRERTGIAQRYFVEKGVSSSDLGVEAAKNAVADAGIDAAEIDYVVAATMTPDHYFPGVGTMIQHGLGIPPRPALDIRQQCAGFAYGLQMVDALIRSGTAKTVLLVGTDVHTTFMPFSQRSWDTIFDDSAESLEGTDEYQWNTQFRHLVSCLVTLPARWCSVRAREKPATPRPRASWARSFTEMGRTGTRCMSREWAHAHAQWSARRC